MQDCRLCLTYTRVRGLWVLRVFWGVSTYVLGDSKDRRFIFLKVSQMSISINCNIPFCFDKKEHRFILNYEPKGLAFNSGWGEGYAKKNSEVFQSWGFFLFRKTQYFWDNFRGRVAIQRGLVYSLSSFPNVKILCKLSRVIKTKKLTLIKYCSVMDFISTIVPFLFQDPIQDACSIYVSLFSSGLWQFLTFLYLLWPWHLLWVCLMLWLD